MGVRHYTLQLTAVGPVHIGSGRKLGKKDYYYPDEEGQEIAVLDAEKFVSDLSQISQNQLDAYVRFLETDSNKSLKDLLEDHPDLESLAQESILYRVSTNFGQEEGGTKRGNKKKQKFKYFEADECMKDIYGCPYVPGSSIKGMLRTAILAFVLDKCPECYAYMYDKQRIQSNDERKKACEDIERAVFKLEKPDSDDPEVINDIMRYVSVSDSAPLSTGDLVFARKYDKFSKSDDGKHKKDLGGISNGDYWAGNAINIYRECLKPGTRFECSIDIDERIDEYLKKLDVGLLDANGIRCILQHTAKIYNKRFLSNFELPDSETADSEDMVSNDGKCQYIYESGLFEGKRCRNRAVDETGFCNTHKDKATDATSALDDEASSKPITCYLGGGVGFSNKTVVNALFSEQTQRVNTIAHTLDAQFPTKIDRNSRQGNDLWRKVDGAGFKPQKVRGFSRRNQWKEDHRHWKDPEFHVSPHTVKLAIVGKKKYLMGACEIKIKE